MGTRPVVIGLAGGIGSGKSLVASMFAEAGCIVSDSDAEARAALDRPEVRERLREWWGEGVLGEDGRVDRARVAAVVFRDPGERRRLEGLIHPVVREARRGVVERAALAGAPAVVIDAPLLYEAGADRECDVVVFVAAPREVRLARVAARGWDAAELERREKAQWDLEVKRGLADHVIVNDGDPAALRGRVSAIFHQILATRPGGPA